MSSRAKLNGVNTQQLGSLMNTLVEKPDISKATFFVKTEWNDKQEEDGGGGFCVRSSMRDFEIGGQTIQRNSSYTMLFDFPEQFSGEGKGPTVCENKIQCNWFFIHFFDVKDLKFTVIHQVFHLLFTEESDLKPIEIINVIIIIYFHSLTRIYHYDFLRKRN
jgi:hypothetical protein